MYDTPITPGMPFFSGIFANGNTPASLFAIINSSEYLVKQINYLNSIGMKVTADPELPYMDAHFVVGDPSSSAPPTIDVSASITSTQDIVEQYILVDGLAHECEHAIDNPILYGVEHPSDTENPISSLINDQYARITSEAIATISQEIVRKELVDNRATAAVASPGQMVDFNGEVVVVMSQHDKATVDLLVDSSSGSDVAAVDMIGLTNRDSPLTRSLVGSVAPYYATHAMASHVNPANLSEEIYYSKIIANVTWSEFLRNNYTPGVTQPTSITVANKLYPVGNTYTVQVNAGGNSLHLSALLFDLVNGDPSNGGINEEGSATREWVGDPSNGIPGVSLNAVEESDASGPAGTSNALPLIGSVIHPDIDDSQVDTTLSIGGIPEGNEYVTQSALYGSTEIDESFWDDQSNNVIAHTVTLHMADFPSGWQADNANIQQVKLLVDGSVDLQMATGDAAEYNANNTGKLSVSGLTDQQIASALQTQTDGLVDAVSGITYSQIEFRPGEDFRLLSPAPITGDDLTWLTTNSDGNQEFVPILSAAGTFSNNSPPSSLYALDSRDLIVGGSSSLNVYAAGDDTIFGGSGTETIQAATQATKIEYRGEGAAHIYDTTNENLHLGSGATTIYLQKGLQDPDISNVYNFDPSKDVIIPKGYTLSDLRQVVDPLSVWSIDAGDVSGAATEQDIQDALNQGFLSDGPDGYGYYPSPDPNAQPMYGTIPGTQTVGWYYWYSVDTPNTDNSFQFESGHNTINIVGDQPLLWTAFGYSGVNVDNMSGDMTVDGGSAGNLVDNGMSTSNLTVNETGGNDTIRAGTGDTTVTTGAGQSQIDLSAQASWALDMVNSGGADAITGGHGKLVASLNGGYIATQTDAQDTINLGSAGSSVYSLGQDVINGTTGNDTVTADGPATINGGTGQSFYTLQNDGLVLNSHGTDSVNADHGGTVTADGTSLYLEDVAEAQLTVQENAPGSFGYRHGRRRGCLHLHSRLPEHANHRRVRLRRPGRDRRDRRGELRLRRRLGDPDQRLLGNHNYRDHLVGTPD